MLFRPNVWPRYLSLARLAWKTWQTKPLLDVKPLKKTSTSFGYTSSFPIRIFHNPVFLECKDLLTPSALQENTLVRAPWTMGMGTSQTLYIAHPKPLIFKRIDPLKTYDQTSCTTLLPFALLSTQRSHPIDNDLGQLNLSKTITWTLQTFLNTPLLEDDQDCPGFCAPSESTMQPYPEKILHHFETMITALGVLKGPIVKIAQMLGMVPGLLPPKYSDALLTLCTQAPGMHKSLLMRKIQLEWGIQWKDHFTHFDTKPIAAASLGQIHKGELRNGQHVAVKIQYPAMKQAVQGDMALFKMLLQRWGSWERSLDMRAFSLEWEQRLYEELDYQREIIHMKRWRALFRDFHDIVIPEPVISLSTSHILTMTWLNGHSIQKAFDQHSDVRNDLGKKIFWAWYYPFYQAGMLHGDPHMGNMDWLEKDSPEISPSRTEWTMHEDCGHKASYALKTSPYQLHIFDFGCVRVFPPMFVQAFCHLYQGLRTHNPEITQKAYMAFGFTPLTQPIIEALNAWAHFLLAPFLIDQECYLDDISSPKTAMEAMKRLYSAIDTHGGTRIPPEFLIFDRVAVILGSLLIRLKVKANWHQLMHPLVQSFCLQKCTAEQNRLLAISTIDATVF